MTKMDDGILQLKIDNLTENLQKYSDKLSILQAKYHKEINELKPNLDQKEAEVILLSYLLTFRFLICLWSRVIYNLLCKLMLSIVDMRPTHYLYRVLFDTSLS